MKLWKKCLPPNRFKGLKASRNKYFVLMTIILVQMITWRNTSRKQPIFFQWCLAFGRNNTSAQTESTSRKWLSFEVSPSIPSGNSNKNLKEDAFVNRAKQSELKIYHGLLYTHGRPTSPFPLCKNSARHRRLRPSPCNLRSAPPRVKK